MTISTGLVLSGGGARGAYEAGVMAGIVEVLREAGAGGRVGETNASPFDIFTGTSVGAINATWLAAHADAPDLAIEGLLDIWRSLDVNHHLKLDPWSFVSRRRGLLGGVAGERLGASLLEPKAFELMVEGQVPWARLHENVRSGRVDALVVAALQVATGRTTLFAELSPETAFRTSSSDPRRRVVECTLAPEHVLASAALPFFFPSRRIGHEYYCDGGIRFNTPIAPALRCGADRLVVVSLLHAQTPTEERLSGPPRIASYPSPIFLLGKVLNALMLDPVRYDLQVLDRINRLLDILHRTLAPSEMEEVQQVLKETRGLPYKRIDTLVFTPSEDIGKMAGRRALEIGARSMSSLLISRVARLAHSIEMDLISFVLFDGEFTRRLIDMGRADVLARRAEVERFFLGLAGGATA